MKKQIALYHVKLTYDDGKDISLPIAPNKLKDFLININQNNLYWIESENGTGLKGFWTNFHKVRYVEVIGIEGANQNEPEDIDQIHEDATFSIQDSKATS